MRTVPHQTSLVVAALRSPEQANSSPRAAMLRAESDQEQRLRTGTVVFALGWRDFASSNRLVAAFRAGCADGAHSHHRAAVSNSGRAA